MFLFAILRLQMDNTGVQSRVLGVKIFADEELALIRESEPTLWGSRICLVCVVSSAGVVAATS